MTLSDTLRERGYAYQHSSATLEEITDGEKRTVYLGIDPSADSLHVGNLVGLLVLRRFLEDGHKVIILTGGGTGMIGDPGGKSEERNLLDEETIARNAKAVAAQIRQVFGSGNFIEVNNATWLSKLNLIEFLRDIGKYFTVNAMIKKDMVRDRIEKESPISFTEFSYSLLQGYDFLHLNAEYDCTVQVGGSDQWSNILAGVEFIRRKEEKTVFALTWPLIMNSSTGKKFGKSEKGAVWLDPEKTTPFEFYQFWLNTEDAALEEYLLKFTLMAKADITALLKEHANNLGARKAQKALAHSVTLLVHGEKATEDAERVSAVLFGDGDFHALEPTGLRALALVAPSHEAEPGTPLVDLLVASKLASSKREARQFLSEGAISLNGSAAIEATILADDSFHHGFALLRRGKRNICVIIRA